MEKYLPLEINSDCLDYREIMRQFLHSLGFVNENNRAEQKEFIFVNLEAIENSRRGNFDNIISSSAPYDWKSILHYSNKEFRKEGLTGYTLESRVTNSSNSFLSNKSFALPSSFYPNDLIYHALIATTLTKIRTNRRIKQILILLRIFPFSCYFSSKFYL